MAIAVAALGSVFAAAAQQPELLPAEQAFRFSVRPLDPASVEARFAIVDGYYLYRDKLKFALDGAPLSAPAGLPPGKIKEDPYFGTVETYRGGVAVRLALPAPAAAGSKVTVTAESQGCAETVGVCYPPQLQKVQVSLPAAGAGPGAAVDATPPRKKWFN